MSTKPALPAAPRGDKALNRFLSLVKQNIELMNGTNPSAVQPLASTATLAQVITAFNLLLEQVNV